MFNSGMVPSIIDGSEMIFQEPIKNMGIPKKFSYMNVMPEVLNQGANPICVPCSLSAYINWDINVKTGKKDDNGIELFDIYDSRSLYAEGMSFKEALKYLQKHGVATVQGNIKIGKYAKVNSFMALRYALVMNGPCVGGLPVYNSYITNFWEQDKSLEGLHAVCIVGYTEDGFIIRNSWGESYGEDGYAFISNEDATKFTEIWTII
jgi:hypothetical protein